MRPRRVGGAPRDAVWQVTSVSKVQSVRFSLDEVTPGHWQRIMSSLTPPSRSLLRYSDCAKSTPSVVSHCSPHQVLPNIPFIPDHLQQPCYHMARKYAEECEREEEEGNLASLNLFQALLFIIRHEIRGRRPLRAWVTIGRAIRLSRILGLHQMDCGTLPGNELSELRSHLAPTDDELLLEERRRSFWALYMV